MIREFSLTLLHSELPKLYGVLAILSAIGLKHNLIRSLGKKIISEVMKNLLNTFTQNTLQILCIG